MNLKTLTIVSSIALAAFLSPAALAQSRAGGNARSHSAAGSPAQLAGGRPSQAATRPSSFQNGSAGTRGRDHNGNWSDHSGNWRHHHRGYYPRYYPYYYSGFGYPFGFGSFGYGYPYGYGYGYGYPYYGASASLYYNGYHPSRSYGGGGGSVVVQVQQRLARSGYYRGPIDGLIGGGTRSAIRTWERDHGLSIDGRIDNRLLSTMDLT